MLIWFYFVILILQLCFKTGKGSIEGFLKELKLFSELKKLALLAL